MTQANTPFLLLASISTTSTSRSRILVPKAPSGGNRQGVLALRLAEQDIGGFNSSFHADRQGTKDPEAPSKTIVIPTGLTLLTKGCQSALILFANFFDSGSPCVTNRPKDFRLVAES